MPGNARMPYLSIGSVLLVRNDCTGSSCALPVTSCAAVGRLFNDRCVTCGTSPRSRVADLTQASFVALGGELERGCFKRDDHDRRLTMQLSVVVREVQVPLLASLLLGGSAAKLVHMLRVRSVDAALGPTALFPVYLRRPAAMLICGCEFALGVGLILTAGRICRGVPTNAVRLGTALLFLVATCALIELRGTRPDIGCGCFGDFSTAPVSGRALARSALLAVAALSTVGLPPLQPPHRGVAAILPLGILAAELALVAVLSPEIGEALVRLGYSEPCELRTVPGGADGGGIAPELAVAQACRP
jgi:hypothetical protein